MDGRTDADARHRTYGRTDAGGGQNSSLADDATDDEMTRQLVVPVGRGGSP